MKYQELRELSKGELEKQLRDLRESYYQQREDVLTGQDSNSAALRHLRRNMARVKTALRAEDEKNRS